MPPQINTLRTRKDQDPKHNSIAQLDRDSAIALGIMLILILGAIAWYFRVRIRNQRAVLTSQNTRRNTNQPATDIINIANPIFRTNSLFSKNTRQDSGVATLSKKSHSCPSLPSFHSSSETACCAFQAQGKSRSESRSSSTSPSYYAPSPPIPPRSKHRRSSSIHSLPSPMFEHVQSSPTKPSLKQAQSERIWWAETTRRGSSTHANRRVSVLEPIPEPEGAGEQPCGTCNCGQAKGKQKVKRSRSYDWTRPRAVVTDMSGGGVGTGGFKEVRWSDTRVGQRKDESYGDGVDRADWASKM